jgi:hypothetical protein
MQCALYLYWFFIYVSLFNGLQSGQEAKFHICLPGLAVTEAEGEPKAQAPLNPAAAAYCGSAACFSLQPM